MSYDDWAELAHYILINHSSLLSPFEQRVESAAMARVKFAACEPGSPVKGKLEAQCQFGDAEINSALAAGLEAFHRSVARRILVEYRDLQINRCPQCNCIVRTPNARQCFWCGYDWHGAKGSHASRISFAHFRAKGSAQT